MQQYDPESNPTPHSSMTILTSTNLLDKKKRYLTNRRTDLAIDTKANKYQGLGIYCLICSPIGQIFSLFVKEVSMQLVMASGGAGVLFGSSCFIFIMC